MEINKYKEHYCLPSRDQVITMHLNYGTCTRIHEQKDNMPSNTCSYFRFFHLQLEAELLGCLLDRSQTTFHHFN